MSRIGGLTSPSQVGGFAGRMDIGVEAVEEEKESVEGMAAANSVFSLEINASSLLAL